jgi:hypothetical protein
MYSDRQTELSIFLEQLQQSTEEKTEERVIIHAVTKADGEKIFEIIIGENPLFAPVVCVEASGTDYGISEQPKTGEKAADAPVPYPVENARHDYAVGNGGLRTAAAMADKPV